MASRDTVRITRSLRILISKILTRAADMEFALKQAQRAATYLDRGDVTKAAEYLMIAAHAYSGKARKT